jgi:acyl-CoA thioester hydrolase
MNAGVSSIELRVRYAETDQMGTAHHANYVVWCEDARTAHFRRSGISYRDLEARGLLLVVVEVQVRYRAPARYDDLLRIDCWVRERNRRRVIFGYAVNRPEDGLLLATAQTSLIALDSNRVLGSLPQHVLDHLAPVADPVRL